jgi:hypothetical protein
MTKTLQTSGLTRQDPRKQIAAAVLTSLGVVYGDIGTSPLYALKQAVWGGPPYVSSPRSRAMPTHRNERFGEAEICDDCPTQKESLFRPRNSLLRQKNFLFRCVGNLAALGSGAATAAEPNNIKVGILLPLTGTFAAVAETQKQGALLAVDVINKRGGLGMPWGNVTVEGSVADDEAKLDVGVS